MYKQHLQEQRLLACTRIYKDLLTTDALQLTCPLKDLATVVMESMYF